MRWFWAVLAFPALAQRAPTFAVDVNLVRVPCVVTDDSGVPVTDLRRENFAVFEDGALREIKYLWQETDLPLTVGLVVDISGSVAKYVEEHRQIVLQFLGQTLSKHDRAFLVSVGIQQRLVVDVTNSTESLRAGVEAITSQEAEILGDPCSKGKRFRLLFRSVVLPCTSPIWNGVFFAARLKLNPQPGRKAMLLLTDGWDMGSDHGLTDAIEACQSADTMVYSIRFFDLGPEWLSARAKRNLERHLMNAKRDLGQLSSETGGRVYDGESANMRAIFKSIEADLRSQYVIGYTQPRAPKQGYHRIKVRVNRPGLVVRTRNGYFAK